LMIAELHFILMPGSTQADFMREIQLRESST
jgi:hypothetical protein